MSVLNSLEIIVKDLFWALWNNYKNGQVIDPEGADGLVIRPAKMRLEYPGYRAAIDSWMSELSDDDRRRALLSASDNLNGIGQISPVAPAKTPAEVRSRLWPTSYEDYHPLARGRFQTPQNLRECTMF